MTIKRRRGLMTIGTTGDGVTTTAQVGISLGSTFGEILKLEVKGDDGAVENSATILITDAEGRIIFSDSGLDFGADDATIKSTGQFYTAPNTAPAANTVGLSIYPVPVETEFTDRLGDPAADTEGTSAAIIAKSPLTVAMSSGTDGDRYQIDVFVRS